MKPRGRKRAGEVFVGPSCFEFPDIRYNRAMPKLVSCLQGQDLSFLRIVAEKWGLAEDEVQGRSAYRALAQRLLDSGKFPALLSSLPESARQAVDELLENQGRINWGVFSRQYGELREMGAGKRERERPFEDSQASVSELLYYRALLARCFLDSPAGPVEYAVLPDEWLGLLAPKSPPGALIFGRPASPAERGQVLPAGDSILDDACTLLAGLRGGITAEQIQSDLRTGKGTPYPLNVEALELLLKEAGLIDENRLPVTEAARHFLEAPRSQSLAALVRTWLVSSAFDELRLLPGIVCEGSWRNEPRRTRQALLSFLAGIPGGKQALGVAGKAWWSLSAFVASVYQQAPDFQRQAGEYESWYLRELDSGELLSGFKRWQQVEGDLLRFMIGGPLHWLGILDLSLASESAKSAGEQTDQLASFRYSAWSGALLAGEEPELKEQEEAKLLLRSNGGIHAPPGTGRALRYQVARFCEWQGQKDGIYRYRLTAAGLDKAIHQGLKVEHILGILSRHAQAMPPSLVQALKRWEALGSQARLENLSVLRLKDPAILKSLRNSEASRLLGEVLGPAAVVVKPSAWQKVVNTLLEMGYVVEEEK